MLKVGIIGWRGIVGSVLIKRMYEEGDFNDINPFFFSLSSAFELTEVANGISTNLLDANAVDELCKLDVVITLQGSKYTQDILPKLHKVGFKGYWLDASSALRMQEDAVIVLDPINRLQIDQALKNGIKNFVGGNCSLTLSLLALAGLFRENLVEWMSMMTYQAASGAGANHVRELLLQMKYLVNQLEIESNTSITEIISQIKNILQADELPKSEFKLALAGNLLPWIDEDLGNGMSKEEWKSEVEANKILGIDDISQKIKVEGICVRVGVVQSHSAAITLKLREDLPISVVEEKIKGAHEWIKLVPNTKDESLAHLNPVACSGSLEISVGRLRKSELEDRLYTLFTVGDQLLWGAAEPLRRMLRILIDYHNY